MKAIQIGDWLQHANGKYYQVTRIDRLGDGNIHFACGFPHLWEYNNKFKPIPITPEILEKNGFKRDPLWHHCDKDLENYSISVQLGYANKIEYIKIAENGVDNVVPSERTKMYLTHVFYLHQLQQAMRIMGCDKEIEL